MTPLHTLKLRLAGAILSALGMAPVVALRFVPAMQKRADTRGRTVATYESLTDAVHDLHAIHDGQLTPKETDHGSYYLAIEIRSASIQKNGRGRHPKVSATVPLPLEIPESVPGASALKSYPPYPKEVAHDERIASDKDGVVREPAAGVETVAGPDEPVEFAIGPPGAKGAIGTLPTKVDLSTIGLR